MRSRRWWKRTAASSAAAGAWASIPRNPPTLDSPQPHREQKLDRVRAGTAHAALVFDGDDCVGWCQFGPPDEVPRIKNRKEYEKQLDGLPDWRIACCFVGKGHRRQGVAAAARTGALELIAGLGGGTVEGYPEPAGDVPAGFLYHGVLSTFEEAGFRRDRKIGKLLDLNASDSPTRREACASTTSRSSSSGRGSAASTDFGESRGPPRSALGDASRRRIAA